MIPATDAMDRRTIPSERSSADEAMSGAAVVLVTTSFPIRGDGSEAAGGFVADLAEELGRHVPVRVVAPGTAMARESWSPGVEVFRYPTPVAALSNLRFWHPIDAIKVWRVLRSGRAATERAVAAGPTAHILALWALPSGGWARRCARRHGIAYSIWVLGSDIWSLGRIPLVRARLKVVLQGAERCWSDGIQLAADTRAIANREVQFLPSTRRMNRQRMEPLRAREPYRLLFLGRWHVNKGIDLLIDALNLLQEADWQRIERVEICGGGPLEPLVRAGVDALLAAGRPLRLGGYLDKSEAEAAILRADYLLIPSRIESIPVVFSDAMKLACPVISMPVGDLQELVAGPPPSGVLAGAVSAESFADAIAGALSRRPAEFENGVQEQASRFDLVSLATRIIETLELRTS